MDIKATGCVASGMGVGDSSSSTVLESNRAILGKPVDYHYVYGDVSRAALHFRIAPSYCKDSYSGSSQIDTELKGIRRYQVFRLYEHDSKENAGLFLPVETAYDTTTNMISAEVDELGTYAVMDMNQWLYDLGIRYDEVPEKEKQGFSSGETDSGDPEDHGSSNYQPISFEELEETVEELNHYSAKPEKFKKRANQQVDLNIVVDVSRSMEQTMNRIKTYIGTLAERLYERNITLHTSLVQFTEYKEGEEDHTKVIKTEAGGTWAKTPEEAIKLLSCLKISSGKEETPIDGIGMGMKLNYRSGADKFMVVLTDEGCNPANRYGIQDLDEAARLLKKGKHYHRCCYERFL